MVEKTEARASVFFALTLAIFHRAMKAIDNWA